MDRRSRPPVGLLRDGDFRSSAPSWRALARLQLDLFRPPGPALALLDVGADQPPHDLRGRRVLLGAESLENGFLAGVDENSQAGSTVFEGHEGAGNV
jgi:hypothetical protein